jgi:hypothetical protein
LGIGKLFILFYYLIDDFKDLHLFQLGVLVALEDPVVDSLRACFLANATYCCRCAFYQIKKENRGCVSGCV